MAEGKKAFLLYANYIHNVKHLTDEQAGQVFKTILAYVNDEDPTPEGITAVVFEPIKQQLKSDLKKYAAKVKQASEAGKRSAEARKKKNAKAAEKANKNGQDKPKATTVNESNDRSTDSTVNVNDNVNVVSTSSIEEALTTEAQEIFNNKLYEAQYEQVRFATKVLNRANFDYMARKFALWATGEGYFFDYSTKSRRRLYAKLEKWVLTYTERSPEYKKAEEVNHDTPQSSNSSTSKPLSLSYE